MDCYGRNSAEGVEGPIRVAIGGTDLTQANDDGCAGHEARNDGVGDEVGDPAQVEQAHQRVHNTSDECNLHSSSSCLHSSVNLTLGGSAGQV